VEERRKSAVVAIVGDEPAFGAALARSLRARGITPIEISLSVLAREPPPHDLALLIGDLALDGGEVAFARLPDPKSPVGVVLRDGALAERLGAHRRGLFVILRKESADMMAADVEKALEPGRAVELGWTSLASILDLLTRSIGSRLSVDASARTELLLGDPTAVAEAIERCADELGMLAFQSRAGAAGPTVAVDELNWDDDPQTAQQSAAEMDRYRKLASQAAQSPDVPPALRFLRPPQRDPVTAAPRAHFEPLSAPSTDLAEILEPEPEREVRSSGVVPVQAASVPLHRAEDEITVPAASMLPAVLRPDLAEPAPILSPVITPMAPVIAAPLEEKKRGTPWIAIVIASALGLVAIAATAGALGYLFVLTPAEAPIAVAPEPVRAPDVAEPHVREPAVIASPVVEEPREPAAPSNMSVDDLVDRGTSNERVEAWDAARVAYEQVLAIEPSNPHALAGLARERMARGDAAGAIRFAERAVSIRRRRASYRVLLGDAYRLAGDPTRARSEYEAAAEIDPEDGEARSRLE
jgi:hypothetical protein